MSQIDTENDKNFKISQFSRFYAFFVEVSTVFLDWTVLKGQKETISCPVVYNEEIVSMFWLKVCQIDTKNDKNLEIFEFPEPFFCIFFQNFNGFYRLERWKRSTMKKFVVQLAFLNSLLQFFWWQWLSSFRSFMHFFVKVSTVFLNWNVLKGQKETFRCSVGFFEEIIAVL